MAKIRNGFVSNSSSCSFVLLGVKLTLEDVGLDNYDDIHEKYDYDLDILTNDDLSLEENEFVIGNLIAQMSDDGFLNDKIISFDEICEMKQNLIEKFNNTDINIYTGIRMC